MNPREELLAEVGKIVSGARNQAYGNPEDNFQNIADLWNAYLTRKPWPLNTMDVAMMMMLMKVARLKTNPTHRDSLVDAAGYAACGADIHQGMTLKGVIQTRSTDFANQLRSEETPVDIIRTVGHSTTDRRKS
jgi:hypothetical protein